MNWDQEAKICDLELNHPHWYCHHLYYVYHIEASCFVLLKKNIFEPHKSVTFAPRSCDKNLNWSNTFDEEAKERQSLTGEGKRMVREVRKPDGDLGDSDLGDKDGDDCVNTWGIIPISEMCGFSTAGGSLGFTIVCVWFWLQSSINQMILSWLHCSLPP